MLYNTRSIDMNGIMKIGFLILLASVIANAAPVQDDLVIAAVVDDVDDRETRSADFVGRIPWHLDRIDQQSSHLLGICIYTHAHPLYVHFNKT